MPRLALELFSGTGSVRKVLEAKGWQVTSLDNDPKAGADITCDICAWDYTTFEPVISNTSTRRRPARSIVAHSPLAHEIWRLATRWSIRRWRSSPTCGRGGGRLRIPTA